MFTYRYHRFGEEAERHYASREDAVGAAMHHFEHLIASPLAILERDPDTRTLTPLYDQEDIIALWEEHYLAPARAVANPSCRR